MGNHLYPRGRYSNFNFVNNSIAENLNDRVTWYSDNQITTQLNSDNSIEKYFVDENLDNTNDYEFGNPNFSAVQFRSNLVVRWEYIPGSELFFVWSQGGAGGADPRESLTRGLQDQILNEQLENTFLIKATYRFVR